MFISPLEAVTNGWVRHHKCSTIADWQTNKFISPNAIDFSLDIVQSIDTSKPAFVGEESKTMRPLSLLGAGDDDTWSLRGGAVYDGTSDLYISVPSGMAAVLWTRSTFARNGVFIVSGLYDAGYSGHVGFTIYTVGGDIDIAKHTRIGQVAFIKADSAGMYAGGWNHEQGTTYNTLHLEQATRIDANSGKAPAGTKNFL